MRYTTCALFVASLLLAGCVTTAADMEPAGPADAPMKSANAIVIFTGDSPSDAYRRTAQLMQGTGYSLVSSDDVLLSMTTDWKQYMGSHRMRLTAFISESDSTEGRAVVTLRGSAQSGYNIGQALLGPAARDDASMSVENTGQGGSPMRRAFEEMQRFAALYDEGRVMYVRQ